MPKDHTITQKEKAIMNWYRKELKSEIPGLIDKWQKII
jgi:predicted metal-dependent hydrolase